MHSRLMLNARIAMRSQRRRVSSYRLEGMLICHLERLILLHCRGYLDITVLAHDEGYRRDKDAVNQVEAAFERCEELNWPRASYDELVHRYTVEEHGTGVLW